jgi:hypothetical protein
MSSIFKSALISKEAPRVVILLIASEAQGRGLSIVGLSVTLPVVKVKIRTVAGG